MGLSRTFFPCDKIFTIPNLGGVQVPLFIIIQAFHFMKKPAPVLKVSCIFTRVLLPFVYVQLFIVFLLYCKQGFSGLVNIFEYFPVNGGYGQGDYYPIVYAQIALILPLFFKLTKKSNNSWRIMVLFIIICECFEILCSIIHIPDEIYRFMAFRYIFLIYFGWKWAKKGMVMDTLTVILSILSLLSVIWFEYLDGSCEPIFVNTAWKYHRWPCYFFTAELLVYGLNYIWRHMKKNELIVRAIQWLSNCSYDIFLAQMVAYVMFPIELFGSIPVALASSVRFIVAFVFSLLFGAVVHSFLSVVTPKAN